MSDFCRCALHPTVLRIQDQSPTIHSFNTIYGRKRRDRSLNIVGKPKPQQSHGLNSRIYVPLLLDIFVSRWRPGASTVLFTLDDVRNAAERLKLEARNPADVIYRMRSRTILPAEIRKHGFHVLRSIGRGRYQFEKAPDTIIIPPVTTPIEALDITPLPVRRLLPELPSALDEQALLTVASYCKLFDHFTGMTIYRLRSHVRKSVPGIGQAELDAVDVGIASSDSDIPVLFPIEAKALADALNRVQICNMVEYCHHYFPGYQMRPLAIKVDVESLIHLMEFNTPTKAADLRLVRCQSYALKLSDQQRELIVEKAEQ